MEARAIVPDKPFQKSWEAFENLTAKLAKTEVLKLDHAELERLLKEENRELFRLLLQDHLNLRGNGETEDRVVGEDEVERTHRRERSRPLRSLFGPVQVTRVCYGARGYDSRSPLDTQLNLPMGTYSLGVRRRAAIEAAKVSFDAVVETLAEDTGAPVPKRQVEELARLAAVDFDAFYAQRQPAANASTGPVLVITTDGKGIVMRKQDLREATRKAAKKFVPKLKKRRSKGEKAGRKRMAQVAAVYTVERFIRTPNDIVGELRPQDDEQPAKARPRPEHKRVWASIEHDAEDVIIEAFDEAARRDPARDKDWVALVDGNETQLDRVLACIPHYANTVTVIVDVIHVLEYMWDAAHAIHGEGKPAAEAWVTKRLRYLLEGVEPSTVAAGIRRSATKNGVTKSGRKKVDACANYLCKFADHLRYGDYIAAGYPIATGVIEGACRHLIKDRMDITGARWSLAGAEAVLRLRALRSSGDLDEYWAFHERQEFARNHLARYANGEPPRVATPSKSRPGGHLRLVSGTSS
jgi:hypothetical protein